MSESKFWNKDSDSKSFLVELKQLKKICKDYDSMREDLKSLSELSELVDKDDEASIKDLETEVRALTSKVDEFEFQKLLDGQHDKDNAILSVNSGAGGTEACDWVSMLLRMYNRWAESKGFILQTVDLLPGDEAGIKNVTVIIKGEHAYGYLKAETGVHRLVRISPFDSNSRRHTSFASVSVIPEISSDVQIQIKDEDLKIDTYRASGPGGQHVNVTDSAVRITHIPTGIVVQSQSERSQHKNKAMALKVLKSRLFELEEQKKKERLEKERGKKKEIAWGSQIRSYVFQPYNMVKDHRTNIETSNVGSVMDGDIDEFIQGYLKTRIKG